jgi:hypothetical protein
MYLCVGFTVGSFVDSEKHVKETVMFIVIYIRNVISVHSFLLLVACT